MCEAHQFEIEFLRKNVELLILSSDDNINKEENKKNKKEKNIKDNDKEENNINNESSQEIKREK